MGQGTEKDNSRCDSCDWTHPELEIKRYPRRGYDVEGWWLCDVCASTFISNATEYNYKEQPLYASLGWIANKILQTIKDTKS